MFVSFTVAHIMNLPAHASMEQGIFMRRTLRKGPSRARYPLPEYFFFFWASDDVFSSEACFFQEVYPYQ